MSARRTIAVAGAGLSLVTASLLVAACASDDEAVDLAPADTETPVPAPDAGAPDAADEGGTCTADDCELFPDTCSPDALCLSGLFDPVDPSVGVDWRTRITTLVGRSPTDAWLVGTVGMAARFDGASWKQADVGTSESLRFFWLTSAGEVSFGSPARLYSRGLGSGDAGVSTDGWSPRGSIAPPPGYSSLVTAAWAFSGSDQLWLATNADVWRLDVDGGTFTSRPGIPQSVCNNVPCKWLRSLHGASARTVWAVGDNGAAVRITGADGEMPKVDVTNPMTWKKLSGVWAASDTEAWAVGGDGTIIHNTGAGFSWEAVPDVPTKEHLNGVAGSSSSDIWAVGNAGVVLHYDGATWSRVKIAGLGTRRPDLYTAWSPAPGKVWIGGQGVLLAGGGNSP